MLMHGLEDTTVEAEATALIYESARGPKACCLLRGCDHTMATRFDDALSVLLMWVPGLAQALRRAWGLARPAALRRGRPRAQAQHFGATLTRPRDRASSNKHRPSGPSFLEQTRQSNKSVSRALGFSRRSRT